MKNINNTISIVTPSYNSEEYIEETILSVLLQKGDFEIDYIIADGGSTDDTLNIVKRYERLINDRQLPLLCKKVNFRWISEKDNGMYEAINKGFKLSKGDVMAYINSDDRLFSGSCQTIFGLFNEFDNVDWITGFHSSFNSIGLCYSVNNVCGLSQKFIQKGFYQNEYLHFIQQEGTFWTRKLWDKAGNKMSDEYKLAGDYDLWIRFSKYSKLYTIHAALGCFRTHPKQLTAKLMDKYIKEMRNIPKINSNTLEKFLVKVFNKLPFRIKRLLTYGLPSFEFDKKNNKWIKKF